MAMMIPPRGGPLISQSPTQALKNIMGAFGGGGDSGGLGGLGDIMKNLGGDKGAKEPKKTGDKGAKEPKKIRSSTEDKPGFDEL